MDVFVEVFANLFDAVLCVFFISRFNNASFKGKKWLIPICSVAVIMAYSMLSDKYLFGFSILSTSLYLALYIIYGLIVCKRNYVFGILPGVIFEATIILVSSTTFSLLSKSLNDFEITKQMGSTVRYIFIAICKIGIFGISMLVLRLFNSRKSLNILSAILSFLLTLTTILGLGMTMNIATQACNDIDTTQIVFLALSFVIINVIFYVLIAQIQKLLENKYRVSLLEGQMEFERKRLEDSEKAYSGIRRVQHDMKNHLTVMRARLDDGDVEGCKEYIGEIAPKLEMFGRVFRSENHTLDYIVNSKLANLTDTKVVVSGSAGDFADLSDIDISCLFGNILDNAVEAVKKVPEGEKYIELVFAKQNSNRIIVCKNTVAAPVLASGGTLTTTKKDKEAHGFGTKIIERVAADHGGMVNFSSEGDLFTVQVVLPEIRK